MAQNITLFGASYTDVPAVLLPKTGGGNALFYDVQGSQTITQNGTVDVSSLAEVVVNVAGGGSGLTLLATQYVGEFNTTSNTATDTGVTISVPSVNPYDVVFFISSADDTTKQGYIATVKTVLLRGTSSIGTKDGSTDVSARLFIKLLSNGYSSQTGTSSYGVYPQSISLSNGTLSSPIYIRYNSTYTGRIQNSYTMRAYGLKLADMIIG